LWKTRGGNSLQSPLQTVVAYTPLSPDEFLVPAGRPIVQYGGLGRRVHCNYGWLIKLRFDERRCAGISV